MLQYNLNIFLFFFFNIKKSFMFIKVSLYVLILVSLKAFVGIVHERRRLGHSFDPNNNKKQTELAYHSVESRHLPAAAGANARL